MNINYTNFSNTTVFHDTKVPHISFKNMDKLDFIRHGFSTRLGGVSDGIYSSMNLTFTRGDDENKVRRNFEIIAKELGMPVESMVYAKQTHTVNVMEVKEQHMGMGIIKERDFDNIDGLVCNTAGITLVTSYADCVPLFFADSVHKAIGLSHSGWRGTVGNIAKNTVNKMTELYGSKPEDIVVFIGPSICRECYEVGSDTAEEFAKAYKDKVFDDILFPKDNGKFTLDLHRANYHNLIDCGIKEENIEITDICTCHNPDILFSHRASHGERGGLCGFLQIK